MRRLCKFLALLAATLLFSFIAVIGRGGLFLIPAAEGRFLAGATRWWSKTMAMILGLHVIHDFNPRGHSTDNFLLVANHQSYLDVVVIGTIFPTLFVAKSDVRKWPVIGWFVTLGGTVYVDRKAFRGAIDAAKKIEQKLSQRMNVQIFPEGTSTNGDHVLLFKPSLFNAAISSHSKILPLTLRYLTMNGTPLEPSTRDVICWYREMNFVEHFWTLLGQKSISVSVTTHPIIPPDFYPDPTQIAGLAYYYVSGGKKTSVTSTLWP